MIGTFKNSDRVFERPNFYLLIYGGEFSFDKISRFSYPASSSRLRALTKAFQSRKRATFPEYEELMKISASGNLLIALLIRRASRATFPDMGRLPLSELPSIDGKEAITFSKVAFSVGQHIQ